MHALYSFEFAIESDNSSYKLQHVIFINKFKVTVNFIDIQNVLDDLTFLDLLTKSDFDLISKCI